MPAPRACRIARLSKACMNLAQQPIRLRIGEPAFSYADLVEDWFGAECPLPFFSISGIPSRLARSKPTLRLSSMGSSFIAFAS